MQIKKITYNGPGPHKMTTFKQGAFRVSTEWVKPEDLAAAEAVALEQLKVSAVINPKYEFDFWYVGQYQANSSVLL